MKIRYPAALTIAGSDSGGGAGIQADLKTFAALGVHGTSIITSLTAQNTLAVAEVYNSPPRFIEAQFKAIHGDFKIEAAKTGMLGTKKIIKTVSKEVGDYPLVVDPVMVAESGGRLLEEDAISVLVKELLPKALVVTPNIYEAEMLGGVRIEGIDEMKKACEAISKQGCAVIVKGGHLNATDVLYSGGEFHLLEGEVIEKGAHGSGCAFSAAITAELAKGSGLLEAAAKAKSFITSAISLGYDPGRGAGVVNPAGQAVLNSEKFAAISELGRAVERLDKESGFERLVPEVGINFVYALPNATDVEEVAGICGRIVKTSSGAKRVGKIGFGCSKHVASIVLTAMKHDPSVRSAMNIIYDLEVFGVCEKHLKVAGFDREKEPKGTSTMEWGTASAIETHGSVPDAIYDKGGTGKEAMIRLLGRDPEEVLGKAMQVLRGLD